jgi:sodium transport system permease protein
MVRFPFVWSVVVKELLTTVRDVRSFRSAIIMPFILTPLFLLGFPALISQTTGGETVRRQTVGVAGLDRIPPALRALLETPNGVILKAVDDPLAAVQAGTVDAGLRVPEGGLPTTAGGKTVSLEVLVKFSNQRAGVVREKLEGIINAYSRGLVVQKLQSLGLSADTLEPVKPQAVNAETAAETAGGFFAFLIPFLLLNAIIGAAATVATDSTAGEKERGSLEILLVSPVTRLEVVLGKLGAVVLYALFGVLVQVSAFLLTSAVGPLIFGALGSDASELAGRLGGNLNLSAGGFVQLLLIGVSLAVMLSGLLVAVCLYARSFKEAQTYLIPVSLVSIFASIGLQFGDFIARSAGLYATPLIGSVIGILDLVKGKLPTEMFLVIIVANLVFGALTAALALRNFRSEQVLFRN